MIPLKGGIMDFRIAFGLTVRELRKQQKKTQEQLGFDADLRRTFVSLVELGQQQPTLTTIWKLAKALGTTPSEMMRKAEAKLGESNNSAHLT
jgi:transcriptional regulator with XRE-family HTH domain